MRLATNLREALYSTTPPNLANVPIIKAQISGMSALPSVFQYTKSTAASLALQQCSDGGGRNDTASHTARHEHPSRETVVSQQYGRRKAA